MSLCFLDENINTCPFFMDGHCTNKEDGCSYKENVLVYEKINNFTPEKTRWYEDYYRRRYESEE